MTTNGESVSRHTTVISIVRRGNTAHVGSVRSSDVDPAVIADLVGASQQTALAAPEARDTAPPLPGTYVPADWDAPVTGTGAQVFSGLTEGLAQGFRGADQLYGYARHIVETTFVATSTGLRRRFTQPTGSVEINAKRDGASAWAGVSTPNFVDVPIDSLLEQMSTRLSWTRRTVELPAGRYETIMPPSTVADMMIHLAWSMDGRGAGGPHGVVGSRRRYPGGREADGAADDVVLRPCRGRAVVHAVCRGAEFVGAGVGVRQRHGHRPGGLGPRWNHQCAGVSASGSGRVRRAAGGARR